VLRGTKAGLPEGSKTFGLLVSRLESHKEEEKKKKKKKTKEEAVVAPERRSAAWPAPPRPFNRPPPIQPSEWEEILCAETPDVYHTPPSSGNLQFELRVLTRGLEGAHPSALFTVAESPRQVFQRNLPERENTHLICVY